MRTLAVTQNITLDGSIEMLDDWFDPADQTGADQDDLLEALNDMDRRSDTLLLGRRTFEDFRGYWPLQTDDASGISAYLDAVHKHVVSSTLTDPQWQHTSVIGLDDVEALKEQDGLDIVCTGSITLTHALVESGLVDEYRLLVYPAVQGRGRRLFPDGHQQGGLRLRQSRSFRGGVVLLVYAAR